MISGTQPLRKASTGVPHAIASIMTASHAANPTPTMRPSVMRNLLLRPADVILLRRRHEDLRHRREPGPRPLVEMRRRLRHGDGRPGLGLVEPMRPGSAFDQLQMGGQRLAPRQDTSPGGLRGDQKRRTFIELTLASGAGQSVYERTRWTEETNRLQHPDGLRGRGA